MNTITPVTHTGRWSKSPTTGEWMVAITEWSPERQTCGKGDTIIVVKRDGTRQEKVADGSFEFPAADSGLPNLFGVRNATRATDAAPMHPLEEGVYVGPDGEYVMVATSDAGHLYGKVWNGERFAYVRGSLRLARTGHRITADEAALFGHTTHRCVFCARKLSRGESTAVGYGPDCASNYGLPWGKEAEAAAVARQAQSAGEAAEEAAAEAAAEAEWLRSQPVTLTFDQREEYGWNRAL